MSRHRPQLWAALEPVVAKSLRAIQNATMDVNVPHQFVRCADSSCATHAAHCVAQQLYEHMNRNRYPGDEAVDMLSSYQWNSFVDARLLIDHVLRIRQPGTSTRSCTVPLPQFALHLRTRCHACESETDRPTLQLMANDCWLRKWTAATNGELPSTQKVLDMFTGQHDLLQQLPSNQQDLLNDLHEFAETCKVCRRRCILPATIQGEAPPFYQIRSWQAVSLGELCATTTLTLHDGTQHSYTLVAIMYGGTILFNKHVHTYTILSTITSQMHVRNRAATCVSTYSRVNPL
jgi:hypothetical protein